MAAGWASGSGGAVDLPRRHRPGPDLAERPTPPQAAPWTAVQVVGRALGRVGSCGRVLGAVLRGERGWMNEEQIREMVKRLAHMRRHKLPAIISDHAHLFLEEFDRLLEDLQIVLGLLPPRHEPEEDAQEK